MWTPYLRKLCFFLFFIFMVPYLWYNVCSFWYQKHTWCRIYMTLCGTERHTCWVSKIYSICSQVIWYEIISKFFYTKRIYIESSSLFLVLFCTFFLSKLKIKTLFDKIMMWYNLVHLFFIYCLFYSNADVFVTQIHDVWKLIKLPWHACGTVFGTILPHFRNKKCPYFKMILPFISRMIDTIIGTISQGFFGTKRKTRVGFFWVCCCHPLGTINLHSLKCLPFAFHIISHVFGTKKLHIHILSLFLVPFWYEQ